MIEADASRDRKVEGRLTIWPEEEKVTRPVREYLDALDQAVAAQATSIDSASDGVPPGNPPTQPKVTSPLLIAAAVSVLG